MQENDLNPRRRRRFVRTTDSDHDGPIFPFLARGFEVHGPDQLWVADLTYITITGGFAYAALILDAWSRRVVGFAIGRSIDARLAAKVLRDAIASRRPLQAASSIRTAAPNTHPSCIGTFWQPMGSSDR